MLNTEIVLLLREQQAEITAMRSLLSALIATHPNPAPLLDAYLDAMNVTADIIQPGRVQHYRDAAQYWVKQLSAASGQQSGPPAAP